MVTCDDGEHGGDVPALNVRDDVKLTLALVDVAAALLGGFQARAGRAHAREAARRVAALPARAVLQHALAHSTVHSLYWALTTVLDFTP